MLKGEISKKDRKLSEKDRYIQSLHAQITNLSLTLQRVSMGQQFLPHGGQLGINIQPYQEESSRQSTRQSRTNMTFTSHGSSRSSRNESGMRQARSERSFMSNRSAPNPGNISENSFSRNSQRNPFKQQNFQLDQQSITSRYWPITHSSRTSGYQRTSKYSRTSKKKRFRVKGSWSKKQLNETIFSKKSTASQLRSENPEETDQNFGVDSSQSIGQINADSPSIQTEKLLVKNTGGSKERRDTTL